MRTILITLAIVTGQWVLIHRYPEPKWVLLTLTVPALLWALSLSGVLALASHRRGGGRR